MSTVKKMIFTTNNRTHLEKILTSNGINPGICSFEHFHCYRYPEDTDPVPDLVSHNSVVPKNLARILKREFGQNYYGPRTDGNPFRGWTARDYRE